MSQHYFNSKYQDRPVKVILGWDRPLGYFFLVIEFVDDEQSEPSDAADAVENEGLLYSNLNDRDAWQKPLSYYRDKLSQFGIAVPEAMFTESLRDEALNVGNRHVWHKADGSYHAHADDEDYFHVGKCNFCGAPAIKQGRYHSGEPVGLCGSKECSEAFDADSADEWVEMAKAGLVYSVNAHGMP
ncbi:MAG: hypothetical protein PHD37_06390 [Gallionellaceae bacterium]|nr:hypothetical protein [Gallionellaceae bacterium]